MADEIMDVDMSGPFISPAQEPQHGIVDSGNLQSNQGQQPPASPPSGKDTIKEINVKVHIRTPDRDSWRYMGRGIVSQEVTGQSSRVVVREPSGRTMATFGEASDLQAEKRGHFVVISCVEGSRVVSWSLNAVNNSDTLRLLASIELACYRCKVALSDPRMHGKARRRIERLIKDDRRKRHRRRKEQDAMIDAFARQDLSGGSERTETQVSDPSSVPSLRG